MFSIANSTLQCPNVPLCGGCRPFPSPYDRQLKEKEERIAALFSKRPILPILASPKIFGYRNKMEFSFSQDKKGNRFLGLYIRKGRGRVIDLQTCSLCPPWFMEAAEKARDWWSTSKLEAYFHRKDHGTLRTLTLREGVQTGERLVLLTISGNPEFALSKEQCASFASLFEENVVLCRQILQKGHPTRFELETLKGQGLIHEVLHNRLSEPMTFRIQPRSFFQPNTLQAEQLYSRAIALADPHPNDSAVDLYCGTGTLSIMVAPFVRSVTGVELLPEAIEDAKANAKTNGLANCTFLVGDAAKMNLAKEPDLLILDPPRAGLLEPGIRQVESLSPKKILYISCNPTTQAADCSSLSGYEIASIQPVCQFPHTEHVENIVLLRRI